METASLIRILKLASPALHVRDFVPVLTHLCFTPSHVFAFNDKTAVVVEHETGLHCAVPGKVLLDIIGGCSAEIALEQKDAEVVIKDKGSTVRLPILQPETFVFDPEQFNDAVLLCTLTPEIVTALELAAGTSNEESIRANLTGVTFTPADDEYLCLYSTNNVTCTSILVPVKFKTKKGGHTGILSKDACELITKTYRDLGDECKGAQLLLGDGYAVAVLSPTVRVIAKLIVAEPADFDKIMDENSEGAEWTECPEALFEAAKRAAILTATDPEKVLSLEPQSGFLLVRAKGRLGEMETKIKAKGIVEGAQFSIDPDMLARAQPWAAEIGLGGRALLLRGALGDADMSIEYMIARRGG